MRIEKHYYQRIINISTPIIIGQTGHAIVSLADNIMVGHLNATALGAVAFANIIIMNLMVLGTGISIGLTPLIGESFVNKGYRTCSKLLQNSLVLNTIISIFIVAILLVIRPFFSYLGQPQEILDVGYDFYTIVSLSIIPQMIFFSFKQFMDGIGNTRITMIITIISNVMNIALNYVFIYGYLGFPAMGVYGAGLATFISRLIMPIIYYFTINKHIIFSKYLKFFSWKNFSLKTNKTLFLLGLPIASQMVVELLALSVTMIMFGWISIEAIAAGQVNMSIIHILFLIVNGIAASTTILTSHAYGLQNKIDIIKYTRASMVLSTIFMSAMAIILIVFSKDVVGLFTSDPMVIEIGSKMLWIVAFMEIFDGLQVTILGGLRGIKDVKKPMRYAVFSYVVIGISMAYFAGFFLGLGSSGIWLGFLSGLIVASSLFLKRFNKIMRKIKFNK